MRMFWSLEYVPKSFTKLGGKLHQRTQNPPRYPKKNESKKLYTEHDSAGVYRNLLIETGPQSVNLK